jgi:hypothetical protein
MTEDIEKYNTFGGVEMYATLRLRQIVLYYDTLSEADKATEKEMLKLINMIVRLKQRNATLAKYVYLTSAPLFRTLEKDLEAYQPKRGKKSRVCIPRKAIQELLGCSRRTAMDFQLAEKIIEQQEAVQKAMVRSVAEIETPHDTISKQPSAMEAQP